MRIRLVILFGVMYFLPGRLPAQTTFTFKYDSSGNRTERRFIPMRKSAQISDSTGAIGTPEQREEIREVIGTNEIRIYPNPTGGFLHIEIPGEKENNVNIRLYDMKGRTIKEMQVTDEYIVLDMNSQPAGIYILSIMVGEKRKDWKILKD